MIRTLSAVIVCILLTGCVTQQVRGPGTATEADLKELKQRAEEKACKRGACAPYAKVAATSIERTEKHALTFLDLDSKGQAKSKDQLGLILNEIESIKPDEKAMVVMFVHGWNHSSRPLDEHLMLFRDVLDDLHDRSAAKDRRVIGIYVSWPARTMVKPFSSVTFFDRSAVAAKIGSSVAFREGVDRIQAAIRKARSRADIAVVSAGHSLGGKLLFSSIEECLQQTTLCRNGVPPLRELPQFGEVMVLVNPAQDVNDYEKFSEYAQGKDVVGLEHPTILTIASEADSVVRHVFHYGRIIKTVFTPKKWGDFRSETIGLGHRGDHTHKLCLGGNSERGKLKTDSALCASEPNGSSVMPLTYGTLTALQQGRPGPFWIVRVDGRLVNGHSDIFTQEFSTTLSEMVVFAASKRPPADPVPMVAEALAAERSQ